MQREGMEEGFWTRIGVAFENRAQLQREARVPSDLNGHDASDQRPTRERRWLTLSMGRLHEQPVHRDEARRRLYSEGRNSRKRRIPAPRTY